MSGSAGVFLLPRCPLPTRARPAAPVVHVRLPLVVAFVVKSGAEGQRIYFQSFRELPPAAVYISVHNS